MESVGHVEEEGEVVAGLTLEERVEEAVVKEEGKEEERRVEMVAECGEGEEEEKGEEAVEGGVEGEEEKEEEEVVEDGRDENMEGGREEGEEKEGNGREDIEKRREEGEEDKTKQEQSPLSHPFSSSSQAHVEVTSTSPETEPSEGEKPTEDGGRHVAHAVEDKSGLQSPPSPRPTSSPPPSCSKASLLPSPYPSPSINTHPQCHFINSQTEQLVGWKNRRSIGLGRGRPSENPRAFMFPGYRSPYMQPSVKTPSPYYPGSWQ